MTISLAYFDVLAFTGELQGGTDGLTQGELQTLDYLACLMAVYDGHEPSWWGFGFSATDTGAPFARELSAAVAGLVATRWLDRRGRLMYLSARGRSELEFQNSIGLNARRVRYLKAAASVALSLPLPSISDALTHEPGLKRALAYMRRKQLLDHTSISLVSEQFAALTEGLGQAPQERDGLTVPAVVWLTYLSREQSQPEPAIA